MHTFEGILRKECIEIDERRECYRDDYLKD